MDNIQEKETMPAVAAEPEVITHKSFEQLDQELQNELEREAEGFVKIGYMLKIFRDTTILENTEYKDVNDYAMKRFHLDKSQVSRFTRINDRFSEGGYSDKLQDKYRGLGYAKLSIMLMLPDSIAEEITPAFSKSEVLEIKDELDKEKEITDIEVMLEEKDERQEEMTTNLQKVVWQMLHDDTELYKKLHELAKRVSEEKFVLKIAQLKEEYHDLLAPQGEAFYSVRIQGMGRLMLSIKEAGKDIKLINARSGEKESCKWWDLIKAVEHCVNTDMPVEESFEHQYAEKWPEQKKEVAPVQKASDVPIPVPTPKKSEPRKQSKVSKAVSKPKKEAPVAAEYEPLKGQTTVEELPGVVPEEYKTVEDEESTGSERFDDVDKTLSGDIQKNKLDKYKQEYFCTIAEANEALRNENYNETIRLLQNTIELVSNMQKLNQSAKEKV